MTVLTPVAFMVFNRPETTEASFRQIRKQRPNQLFIVADGPRAAHPEDQRLCTEVRTIVEHIDWPCEVLRDYAPQNLGLRKRFETGLDWVFSLTDRAIVLEDDCVAHPDFFRFCDSLLDRYADDERVSVVTGDNFQKGIVRGDASYYFSRYNHVWGWATWNRAWAHYDGTMSFWADWKASSDWRQQLPDAVERGYWEQIFDQASRGKIDSWDYVWTACLWYAGGLTATPNANLVANIGFDRQATHTRTAPPGHAVESQSLGPLTHPESVNANVEADRFVFDTHFGGASLRARQRPLGFLSWFVTSVIRVTMRAANRWVPGSRDG